MEHWMGGAATVIAAIMLLNWRFGNQSAGDTYGTTRWANPFELFHKGAFKKGGIRVGDIAGRKSVFYHGSHSVTIGATGSGKGIAAIVPTSLERDYIFLIDPGGENTAIAAKHWRAKGYAFFCINPFEEFTEAPWALPVHGFNPLGILDPASPRFLADVTMIAEMLLPQRSHESATADFFRMRALAVIRGMIVYIVTAEPTARRHLGTLYEYMTLPRDGWVRLLRRMQGNASFGGIIAATAELLIAGEVRAPEETQGVLSTINKALGFLDDPQIRDFLARSEVDFEVLKGMGAGTRGAVISVILPLKYLNSHMVIQRLAVACAIKTLQSKPLAKSNVLMLLDEAASLGRIEDFPVWLATLRKYNVSIWSIWQNIGQIKELYGRSWEVVLGNCGLKQFLSIGDLETAKYVEELIGRATVHSVSRNHKGERSLSQCARPLKLAEELLRLPSDRQVAQIDNNQPLVLRKTAYFERPEFAGRCEDNPYRQGLPSSQPGVRDALMALWGDVYGALVWWMAPSKPAALVYLLLALIAALKLQAVL